MKAADFKQLTARWASVMRENQAYLIQLDSVVGDSDLGLTMADGFQAAAEAAAQHEESDLGKLAYFAGKAMAAAVPSTMGTLMAAGFMHAGKALRDRVEWGAAEVSAFFAAYAQGVQNMGKAKAGDKTFLDGLQPAVAALQAAAVAGVPPRHAAAEAARAAHEGFLATQGMLAKHGRAAGRGEASRPLLDPGAAVADLMMRGYADFVAEMEMT
ncbi:MAG: DAK2 domain-containing protein [Oscillospiraceae bacterium]|jgi:dihydroxyacetone kinase-like protein|nr:DAK2 domain-containing protein [Oscillospiraceae bacterium]